MTTAIFQPNVGSLQTMLSTEINSLSNGSACSASSAFNNVPAVGGSNGYDWADFELVLATGSNTTAYKTVDLYIIESVDGTNYQDTGGPPPNGFLDSFVLQAATSQRIILRNIPLPPTNFKILVVNNSGVAASASGSTVKMLPYNRQVN